jgi:hypothetical protein
MDVADRLDRMLEPLRFARDVLRRAEDRDLSARTPTPVAKIRFDGEIVHRDERWSGLLRLVEGERGRDRRGHDRTSA